VLKLNLAVKAQETDLVLIAFLVGWIFIERRVVIPGVMIDSAVNPIVAAAANAFDLLVIGLLRICHISSIWVPKSSHDECDVTNCIATEDKIKMEETYKTRPCEKRGKSSLL
jgi:hypothetical protein